MFGVLMISFKASYNDSMGKDNTENKIFPLSQHKYFRKMSVLLPSSVLDVTFILLTQLTVTPEKNYDAWLSIAYRKLHVLK